MRKTKQRRYNEKLKRRNKWLERWNSAEKYRNEGYWRLIQAKDSKLELAETMLKARNLLLNAILVKAGIEELEIPTKDLTKLVEKYNISEEAQDGKIIYKVKKGGRNVKRTNKSKNGEVSKKETL